MHSPELRRKLRRLIPSADVRTMPGTTRHDVIAPLPPTGNIGIELGVAAGSFSAAMVRSGRFARFWGVDAYIDGHSVGEYKRALLEVGLDADYRLLRMTFEQALDLFPEKSFDFVYCDGFAHTGEDGGRMIVDWFTRLKPGGIMAGDDYDIDRWPLVVWAANHAANQLGVPLFVTDLTSDTAYNRYRSWSFFRPLSGPDTLSMPAQLMEIGDAEKVRIAEERRLRRLERRAANKA